MLYYICVSKSWHQFWSRLCFSQCSSARERRRCRSLSHCSCVCVLFFAMNSLRATTTITSVLLMFIYLSVCEPNSRNYFHIVFAIFLFNSSVFFLFFSQPLALAFSTLFARLPALHYFAHAVNCNFSLSFCTFLWFKLNTFLVRMLNTLLG